MGRRWIPVVFWIVFVAVLALSSRFPALKAVWQAMLLVGVGALALNYLLQVLRNRPVPSCSNTRWWMRFVMEKESEPPKRS